MTNKTEIANQAACKGSLQLGSGCGSCLRCKAEIKSVFAKLEAAKAELSRLKTEKTERELRLEGVITKQEAEIAKLKGDAVPVAYGTLQPDFKDEERSLFLDREFAEDFSRSCYELTPLFTHAQPVPVVVLPGYGILESTTDKSLLDWQDGWDACLTQCAKNLADAGIVVKPANGEGE